jgi:signal transduction histidine kinase
MPRSCGSATPGLDVLPRAICDFWTMPLSPGLVDNGRMESVSSGSAGHHDCEQLAEERDPDVLRAALRRETAGRRRAECLARMQTEVVQLALDLLVREPDIDGFFGVLTKTMVEEGDSHACGVWLIDDEHQRCDLWMAYVVDRLYTRTSGGWDTLAFPRESMGGHLFAYTPGWTQTVEYRSNDHRLPEAVREFNHRAGVDAVVIAPLVLGSRTLGWIALSSAHTADCGSQWWRIVLSEAIARQAALALHQSRLAEQRRLEERRKTILEERNRLARDIHDNLAQGFAAILMQLQGAQREACYLPPAVTTKLETAIDLARRHMIEARRSVGTLRPNVGNGEDVTTALRRIADLAQRTSSVPIEISLEELPRFGDGVEREVLGIAQEALNNAVRHSRARRITVRASTVRSIGLRLSVADDGRGIARERPAAGFGLTSMQERAERIGASLTIVTAPRSGTEVVLAWEPASLPTQVHVAT